MICFLTFFLTENYFEYHYEFNKKQECCKEAASRQNIKLTV